MRFGRGLALALVLVASSTTAMNAAIAGVARASRGGTMSAVHPRFRGETKPLRAISGSATRSRAAVADLRTRLNATFALNERLSEIEGDDAGRRDRHPAPPDGPTLPLDGSGSGMLASFEGLNSFHSVWSNDGNQFDGEPPDQGLCVGNGFELEAVNTVVQVYDPSGNPQIVGQPFFPKGPSVGLSLNEFFGFPPEIDFNTGVFGRLPTDPSCYYDSSSRRWFLTMLSLGQDPTTGDFTGDNSLELAVSGSRDPLGTWNLYSIPAQNDGTFGTPDHGCDGGFCIGDYPQIGADANGFYITTNEYAFFGDGYNGVQLYAFSKADLASGSPSPATVYLENLQVPSLGQQAFTLRPAQSSSSSFETGHGGVEYFVSSTLGDGSETGNTTGRSNNLVLWGLSNTSSLDSGTPDLKLSRVVVRTIPYVLPPKSFVRRASAFFLPVLDCINLGSLCAFPQHDPPFIQKGPYPLDSLDTRVMSSSLADGVLWTTLDTGLEGNGGSAYKAADEYAPRLLPVKAGVAYFGLRPKWRNGKLKAKVVQQGYIGVRNGNLTMPSLAMTDEGVGFLGATLVGPRSFASAAYVRIEAGQSPRSIGVAARGAGPNDGFTGTWLGGFGPRWGDYGYAVADADGSIWLGVEYNQSKCDYVEWAIDITCGFSRGIAENWSTRLVQLDTGTS
jgi:hypothetical protein